MNSITGDPGPPQTSAHLRRVTAEKVLRALREKPVMSVTELMDDTGLSRSAVHKAGEDLIGSGWAARAEALTSEAPLGRGRPPRLYRFAAETGVIVSVDFGVNNLRVGVADLRGKLLSTVHRQREDHASEDRLGLLEEAVQSALQEADTEPDRVRILTVGVPMALSSNSRIFYPSFQQVIDLTQEWAAGHGWPVLVENDANLAALAERRFGVAQNHDNVVVLLAGERLGAGIVVNGTLMRGEHASAGELRFLSQIPGELGEGIGIGRQGRELASQLLSRGRASTALKAEFVRDKGVLTASTIFRAAASGGPDAMEIVHTVSRRLATVIGMLSTVLDPARVIISGGLAEAGDLLATTTQKLLPVWMIDNPPEIHLSAMSSNAVIVGGISLALGYLEEHALDGMDG